MLIPYYINMLQPTDLLRCDAASLLLRLSIQLSEIGRPSRHLQPVLLVVMLLAFNKMERVNDAGLLARIPLALV